MVGNLLPPYDLVVQLLYGCGLRLGECMKLRVNQFNFDHHVLTVHDGKGKKDRTVPLPEKILEQLKSQLNKVILQHEADMKDGYSGVFLPDRLEAKYKNAPRELIWQWFFPARELTFVEETGEYRRYHLHETHVQKVRPLQDALFCPISSSCSNFNPQNIQYIPPVKIIAFLELEQN